MEEQSLLGFVGESDEARFAVGVGADFEIQLVERHESVGDVDFDPGVVDRRLGGIGYGEIGGAGADAAINYRDGFRVGGGGLGVQRR